MKEKVQNELLAFKDQSSSEKEWKNRQRTLIVSSRGINSQFRYLIIDIMGLLPHSKKEAKIERKTVKNEIDDLCLERSCNNCIYFEQRKGRDFFMWFSKSPSGPSFKCVVQNIHTTDELKLSGNNLKFSRPILSFDKAFDELKHLTLMKEMLIHTFDTPRNHPKSKPFIDHVFSFNYFDGRIWFRNYQIVNQHEQKFTAEDDIEKLLLIEIGPRFCLLPIKAFEGTMGGEPLWQNPNYISPSKLRSKKYDTFVKRRDQKEERKVYKNLVTKKGRDPDGYLQDAFE